MSFTKLIETFFKRLLPSPFTIAVLLTVLTIVLALFFSEAKPGENHLFTILSFWEQGIWNNGLLVFAYQMMLVLVLGHVLVLSKPMEHIILQITKHVTNTANAAVLVTVTTLLVAFFNWGLGLIFGALLVRKIGEYAQAKDIKINYPLLGACGYAGLMVWHGGISGSAPLKVSEEGHLKELMANSTDPELLALLPNTIPTSGTIFSAANLIIFFTVLVAIAGVAFYLGKKGKDKQLQLEYNNVKRKDDELPVGAERLDHAGIVSVFFGLLILSAFTVQYLPALQNLNITPNMLNFFMLGLAILLHGSFRSFLNAVEIAIGDVAGILIQFPLYFGIMGIMGSSGMITTISDFFVSVSTKTTLPLFTFLSAGLVNIFVPSGGGQWAVQGPLAIQSALQLKVPLEKIVMALAYGDQLTNMLQPFWALPLLGITKLKAKEILPYTLIFMLVGGAIYILGLLLF